MTEDWNVGEMVKGSDEFPVLGLLGPAGSGKDLVADWFCEKKNFVKVPFADPIKRFASRCFGIDWDRLWGPSEKRNEVFEVDESWWRDAAEKMKNAATEITQEVLEVGVRVEGFLRMYDWLKNLRTEYPDKISARFVLQTLGTEWGRSVDELMWAKYAHKVARRIRDEKLCYTQATGLATETEMANNYKGVIIPDHRFNNEIKVTQNYGGYVIRLRRLALEQKDETVGISGHRSEAEQKTIPDSVFDHVCNFGEGVDKVYEQLEGVFEQKLWINTRGRS